MSDGPIRIDFRKAHEESLVPYAWCGHERARHIDRDDFVEPCDLPECECRAFVESTP